MTNSAKIIDFLEKKMKKDSNVVFVIAVGTMIVSVFIAFHGFQYETTEVVRKWFFKEVEQKVVHKSPFTISGLGAVYSIILYSVFFLRNRGSLTCGNHINLKFCVLHFLNIIFLMTIFFLFPNYNFDFHFFSVNINFRILFLYAIISSLLFVKEVAKYIWIIFFSLMIFQLNDFDNYGQYAIVYVLSAYVSIVCQVCFLNLFGFDKIALLKSIRG